MQQVFLKDYLQSSMQQGFSSMNFIQGWIIFGSSSRIFFKFPLHYRIHVLFKNSFRTEFSPKMFFNQQCSSWFSFSLDLLNESSQKNLAAAGPSFKNSLLSTFLGSPLPSLIFLAHLSSQPSHSLFFLIPIFSRSRKSAALFQPHVPPKEKWTPCFSVIWYPFLLTPLCQLEYPFHTLVLSKT